MLTRKERIEGLEATIHTAVKINFGGTELVIIIKHF